MTKRLITRLTMLLIALLIAPAIASAESITYTATIAPGDANASVKQFDPSLGNLTGVYVDISGTMHGNLGFENRSSSSGATFSVFDWDGYFSITNPLVGTDSATISFTYGLGDIPNALAKYDGAVDYAGTSGFTLVVNNTHTVDFTYTSPALLLAATGLGQLTFDSPSDATYNYKATNGNLSQSYAIETYGNVLVKYTYTAAAVPEPLSLLLLGTGLLTVGAVLRRRL